MTCSAYLKSISMAIAACLLASATTPAQTPPPKPETNGRPVYLVAGKVVVFPEGVEESPADYKGSIGPRPLALIKLKDKLIGEVFAAALPGGAKEEAKGMEGSADNGKIRLLKRETIKVRGDDVEVVTLRMDANSNVGRPWILHSLYFPLKSGATTFKLAVSEEQFKTVLPYFETMLFFGNDEKRQ